MINIFNYFLKKRNYPVKCAISRYYAKKNQYSQIMKRILLSMQITPLPLRFFTSADYVWLHWYENNGKFALWFLNRCQRKGKKIIWNVHNKLPHSGKNKEFAGFLMKHLAQTSHKIVIHSMMTTDIIKEISNNDVEILNKIVYVPHPHYIDIYGQKLSNNDLNDNILRLCFIGAVKKYKNVDLLISAVNELGFDDLELNIYGRCRPKKYAEYLQRLTNGNKNIKLHLKFVRDDELPKIIADSHLIVLPYNLDSTLNSGSTILAFSYGRTVLSPNTGTLSDIDDKSLFFSYTYENETQHKAEIKRYLTDIKERYKGNYNDLLILGEKCKEYVILHNSYQSVATQLEQVFK